MAKNEEKIIKKAWQETKNLKAKYFCLRTFLKAINGTV